MQYALRQVLVQFPNRGSYFESKSNPIQFDLICFLTVSCFVLIDISRLFELNCVMPGFFRSYLCSAWDTVGAAAPAAAPAPVAALGPAVGPPPPTPGSSRDVM